MFTEDRKNDEYLKTFKNKYDFFEVAEFQIKHDNFRDHVEKHFDSLDDARKTVALSGKDFSVFKEKYTLDSVSNAIVNVLENSDKFIEKVLRQKDDVKEYTLVIRTTEPCGVVIPAAGKEIEVSAFKFGFRVYRNVRHGNVEFELEVSTTYPTKK